MQLLICMLFSLAFVHHKVQLLLFVIGYCNHSIASVHCWPCPVLSAKEVRSMKVGSACVSAVLWRPAACYYSGSRDQVEIDKGMH